VPVAPLHRAFVQRRSTRFANHGFQVLFGCLRFALCSHWLTNVSSVSRRRCSFTPRCCGNFSLVLSSSEAVSTRVVAQQALRERLAQSRSRLKLIVGLQPRMNEPRGVPVCKLSPNGEALRGASV
jgi:hypothetical protein